MALNPEAPEQALNLQSARALSAKPGSLRAWILAARPQTLVAGAVPVAVGSACAHALGKAFDSAPALAALVGALLLQVGCNFANDVFDAEKGADTAERLGPAARRAGRLARRARDVPAWARVRPSRSSRRLSHVRRGLADGRDRACRFFGIAYTGGPFPLGYHGLGDLFVFVFFGFVAVAARPSSSSVVPPLAVLAAPRRCPLDRIWSSTTSAIARPTRAPASARSVRFGERATIPWNIPRCWSRPTSFQLRSGAERATWTARAPAPRRGAARRAAGASHRARARSGAQSAARGGGWASASVRGPVQLGDRAREEVVMCIVSLELERRSTTPSGASSRRIVAPPLDAKTGRSGHGEASPLPGYSLDDLASCGARARETRSAADRA